MAWNEPYLRLPVRPLATARQGRLLAGGSRQHARMPGRAACTNEEVSIRVLGNGGFVEGGTSYSSSLSKLATSAAESPSNSSII